MKPRISVIIPTYNEEKYLPKLLKDLSQQTVKEFEVVVSDGHSTDKTVEKAKKFEKQLQIHILQSPIKGVAAQRNYGASQATGDYLFFLDADMRVEKNIIRDLLSNTKKHNRLLYIPTHVPDSKHTQDELLYKIQSFFIELSHYTKKPFTYGPAVLFVRSFFEHLGPYDEKIFAEDQEIIQRARDIGVVGQLLPDVVVYFSTRRYEHEGRINVMRKYLRASIVLLTEGKVDKEIFTYEMGGSADYLIQKKKKEGFHEDLKKNIEKLRLFLEDK